MISNSLPPGRSGSIRTSLAAVVAAGCVLGAVLAVNTQASTVLGTDTAGAWFANQSADSVSHLGPAGVDATVTLDGSVGELSVVELDGVAYITDADGTLSRIDPAQLAVSTEVSLPSPSTRLVAGGGRLYALDDRSDTVRELDPATLAAVGPAVEIDGELGAAVVDPSSTLWFADASVGDVVSFAAGAIVDRVDVDAAGPLALSAVRSHVVAIDPAASRAVIVGGERAGTEIEIPVRAPNAELDAPETVAVGSILPIVVGDADIALVDLASGSVALIALPDPDHDYGTPQITSTKAYVPDYTDGSLVPFRLPDGAADRPIVLTGDGGRFEVVADTDALYASDRNSARAWAVDDDGSVTVATKYDIDADAEGGVTAVDIPDAPDLAAPPEEPEADDEEPAPTTTAPGDVADDRRPTPTTPTPSTPTPPTPPVATLPPIVLPVAPPPTGTRPPTAPPTPTIVPLPTVPAPNTTAPPTPPDTGGGTEDPPATDAPTTTVPPKGNGPRPTPTTTPITTTTTPAVVPTTAPRPVATTTTTTVPPTTLPPTPGAPTSVGATAGDGQATVSWQPGATNGASIAEYLVRNVDTGATVTVGGSARTATFTGLSNGTAYRFDVRAISSASVQSPRSAASAAVVPSGAPAAPGGVSASAASPTAVNVSFAAATSSNGTAVSSWQVTLSPGGASQVVSAGSASFGGLSPSTTYTVSVVAIGANGMRSGAGTASATTPSGRPGAIPYLNLGNRLANWGVAPGATGYRVDRDGGIVTNTTATSADIGPVPAGEPAFVTVTPYNQYGDGPSISDVFFGECNTTPIKPVVEPCVLN